MRQVLIFALAATVAASAANPPQRIVSLSPDLTEMLYGVGAFSRVVGVSDYETYPPETSKLPKLGPLHSPSYEKLTALRPDLVIINNAQAPFFEDTLQQLGMRVLITSNRSIQETYDSMLALGRATGNERQAGELVATTRAGLERVTKQASGAPKPSVVLVVDRTPGTLRDLSTATAGSYLAEIVEMAGGHIVAPPSKTGYSRLSKEDLLALNPAVILDFIQGSKGIFAGNPLDAWNELPELTAHRTHRIYEVDQDFVPHASQRMVQTAELFVKLIHPELH
jgi:iron complex transport system substrate-binding protein